MNLQTKDMSSPLKNAGEEDKPKVNGRALCAGSTLSGVENTRKFGDPNLVY